MFFNHMIMDQNGKIHGKGSDAIGHFSLSGHCTGTFELHVDQPSWSGWYHQGGQKHNMEFGLCVSGSNVFGNGYDTNGAFSVSGKYDQGNGHMTFTKYYYGAHSVNYRGQQHHEGGASVIRGDWCIPGMDWDKFELKMHH